MQQCFVIQPFDGEKFDKRYRDVFEPAISGAGLKPYRVDQDPSTQEILKAILDGIARSSVCLVEISTDNPNVWFELGYSIAKGLGVVLLCSNEREGPYPFDVSHLAIVEYSTDSPSDFNAAREKITDKLKALIESRQQLDSEPIEIDSATDHDLSPDDIATLCGVANIVTDPWTPISTYEVSKNIQGISGASLMISIRVLVAKSLIERYELPNTFASEVIEGIGITQKGWGFLRDNRLKPEFSKHMNQVSNHMDDIPF